MDFVDEQDCFLTRGAQAVGRRSNDAAHFRDVAFNPADAHELRMCHIGDDVGQRRFARARRPREDHRGQTIGFDCAAQEFARSENMFLADKLLQGTRPHSSCEWRRLLRTGGSFSFLPGKKIVHEGKYGARIFSASHFELSATRICV